MGRKKTGSASAGIKKEDIELELYNLMIRKGYSQEFAQLVSREMRTEFTGRRMIGYIAAREGALPMEEVADEMMAILSDRERLIKKHISQNAQAAINEMYAADWDEETETVEEIPNEETEE